MNGALSSLLSGMIAPHSSEHHSRNWQPLQGSAPSLLMSAGFKVIRWFSDISILFAV